MTAAPPLSGERDHVPVQPVLFSHTPGDEPVPDQGELQRPGRAPFTAPPANPHADADDDLDPTMAPRGSDRTGRPRTSARAPRRTRY